MYVHVRMYVCVCMCIRRQVLRGAMPPNSLFPPSMDDSNICYLDNITIYIVASYLESVQ